MTKLQTKIFLLLQISTLLFTASCRVLPRPLRNHPFRSPNGQLYRDSTDTSDSSDNDPNYYNPNFDYPEVFSVDPASAGVPFQGEVKTGYIDVYDGKSKLFYMLYAAGGANNSAATLNNSAPVILWLQGGPGCASADGNYEEIGPIKIFKNNNGSYYPGSRPVNWNDQYNLLFVDSPIGVGYSVTSGYMPSSALEAAQHLQRFLVRFFELYPQLNTNGFYAFGESYGGHYVPALGATIVQNITNNKINIKGVGVGNGCTDPYLQIASFAEIAFSMSLLDENTFSQVVETERQGQLNIAQQDYTDGTNAFNNAMNIIGEANENFDTYNFQVYESDSSDDYYISWLNVESVKSYHGVDPNITYIDCVGDYYSQMFNDITTSYRSNYTYLLTQTAVPNLKVLIYGGQNDLVCNNVGVQDYLRDLEWSGREGFYNAQKQILKAPNGTAIGNYRYYGNLAFSVIYNAGHPSPQDQPATVRELLGLYMNDYNS